MSNLLKIYNHYKFLLEIAEFTNISDYLYDKIRTANFHDKLLLYKCIELSYLLNNKLSTNDNRSINEFYTHIICTYNYSKKITSKKKTINEKNMDNFTYLKSKNDFLLSTLNTLEHDGTEAQMNFLPNHIDRIKKLVDLIDIKILNISDIIHIIVSNANKYSNYLNSTDNSNFFITILQYYQIFIIKCYKIIEDYKKYINYYEIYNSIKQYNNFYRTIIIYEYETYKLIYSNSTENISEFINDNKNKNENDFVYILSMEDSNFSIHIISSYDNIYHLFLFFNLIIKEINNIGRGTKLLTQIYKNLISDNFIEYKKLCIHYLLDNDYSLYIDGYLTIHLIHTLKIYFMTDVFRIEHYNFVIPYIKPT
jgi:hypothetical protein